MNLVEPASEMSSWQAEEPRSLLRAMSMTVCDLSAITKPWEIEKRVADLVSSEFFEQGDMERQELNITPIVSSRCTIMLVGLRHIKHIFILLFFAPPTGYNESREGGSIANDAGWLY